MTVMAPDLFVVAQTVCTLPQCTVCANVDPNSWEWILKGCWMIGSASLVGQVVSGVFAAAYLAIQLWSRRAA